MYVADLHCEFDLLEITEVRVLFFRVIIAGLGMWWRSGRPPTGSSRTRTWSKTTTRSASAGSFNGLRNTTRWGTSHIHHHRWFVTLKQFQSALLVFFCNLGQNLLSVVLGVVYIVFLHHSNDYFHVQCIFFVAYINLILYKNSENEIIFFWSG